MDKILLDDSVALWGGKSKYYCLHFFNLWLSDKAMQMSIYQSVAAHKILVTCPCWGVQHLQMTQIKINY